jgi:multisubunit Na+/H+ antiporter MnhC subunit
MMCTFMGLFGNGMYLYARDNLLLLLVARAVAGTAASSVFCGFTHLTRTSHPSVKDKNLTIFTWVTHLAQV